MLKYGIIGIGNCGGQIAAKGAKELGVDTIIINTSDQDLETLETADNIASYLLGDKRGAGQDREAAKKALEGSINQLVSDAGFTKFLDEMDLIYIASSTGGGSGSGIAPLLCTIVDGMCDGICIMVGVLPTLGEDRGYQINTLNYFDDLYNKMEGVRYMLFDNNKFAAESSSTKMMEKINQNAIDAIKVLSGYYNASTKYASIDDNDMKRLLSPFGGIIVGQVKEIGEKDLDTSSIEEMMVNDLKTNSHCEFDRDGVVQNTGIITNLSPKLNESFNMNIPVIHAFSGEPLETGFKHIAVNQDAGMPNNVFFIATGMSPVNDRIRKINERVAELDAKRAEKRTATALKDSVLENTVSRKEKKATAAPDILSIFDRFGVKK